MFNTPSANKMHIGIFGNRNAGKSSLFNKLLEQELAIISKELGTTTDPIRKSMELIPFGPIILIDTAGLDDTGELGIKRKEKTIKTTQNIDFALYLFTGENIDEIINEYNDFKRSIKLFNTKVLPIYTKCELLDDKFNSEDKNKFIETLKNRIKDIIFISVKNDINISLLKQTLIDKLTILRNETEESLLREIIIKNNIKNILLVVKVDSEAPKNRLILPQVQVIRDALDNNVEVSVVKENMLEYLLLDNNRNIDIIITDSQIFKYVSNKINESNRNILLTSFSMVYAKNKGDINNFIKGVDAIYKLNDGDKVLIYEACTHNTSHEDIGRVKIPKALKMITNKNLDIHFRYGKDFNINDDYKLIIHCGACMLNKKTIQNRIILSKNKDIPMTNYGIILAKASNILDDAIKPLI